MMNREQQTHNDRPVNGSRPGTCSPLEPVPDTQRLDDIRRFYLDPQAAYSIRELAAIWRVDMEDANEYWVQVAVRLESPLETPDGGAVREYRVNLGVACDPEQIKDIVISAIHDGNIIWSDTEWRVVDREAIADESIRGRTNFQLDRGVWYRSGRILLAE